MRESKQTPLTLPRGLNPHDFKQSLEMFEAAVFDNATVFAAVAVRPRRRAEFESFEAALEFVSFQHDPNSWLIYASTSSGRTMIPDRAKWSEWSARSLESARLQLECIRPKRTPLQRR